MLLKSLTEGRISGTGTVVCESGMFAGCLISTDATNAAVISIQEDNSSGDPIFELSTVTAQMVVAPFKAARKLYYSITGTGATAQLYEWVQ